MRRIKEIITKDWAKPAWAAKLETASAGAGLIVFIWMVGGYIWNWIGGDVGSFLAFLTRRVSVPIGIVLSVPVFLMMVTAYVIRRRHLRSFEAVPNPLGRQSQGDTAVVVEDLDFLTAEKPHVVTAADTSTLIVIKTDIVDASQGCVSLWAFVDHPDRGIRNLKDNRYLFAQAGNRGRKASIGAARAYIDVFALSCSPAGGSIKTPIWRFYISEATGERVTLKIKDTLSSPEWHHFAVRWDHSRPLLEFIIDGRVVGSSIDYRSRWPRSQGEMTFGTWPTRSASYYIESKLWRIRITRRWIQDHELQEELGKGSLVK